MIDPTAVAEQEVHSSFCRHHRQISSERYSASFLARHPGLVAAKQKDSMNSSGQTEVQVRQVGLRLASMQAACCCHRCQISFGRNFEGSPAFGYRN